MAKKRLSILNLERYLPYRISILSNRVSGVIAKTYQNKFGLSISEWRIMAVVGEYPSISADEVSVKTQIEKSIISRSLQKLLKRQLVVRTVDTEDRRRQNLTLSKTGEDVYKQIVPVSYDYQDKLLKCLTKKEQEVFEDLVDRLYQHAERIDLKD